MIRPPLALIRSDRKYTPGEAEAIVQLNRRPDSAEIMDQLFYAWLTHDPEMGDAELLRRFRDQAEVQLMRLEKFEADGHEAESEREGDASA